MGGRLYINSRFFDRENPTRWYIEGAFFGCCNTNYESSFEFRSKHIDLVQLVKEKLQSEHKILTDNRGKKSYWLCINSDYLRKKQCKLGMHPIKSEREFPEMKREKAMHFIRGFLDAKSCLQIINNTYTRIKECIRTMIREVIVPELGDEISEVCISYWHFKEDDHVEEGQDLLEVTTDKAAVSISAPATGILKIKNYQEGDNAAVGTVIAIIEEE